MRIIRTRSDHVDFIKLVADLDADLRIRDGADHAFFAHFNKIDTIKHVVIAFENDKPAGCGAIKTYSEGIMEIKRMYVAPELRGKGIATTILTELERWAFELGYDQCILETGIKQPEAIGLYKKQGYTPIPNYGQYEKVITSVCMQKHIG
jgi:putative acetyltransferase